MKPSHCPELAASMTDTADTPLVIKPLTDFSRADARQAMKSALEQVRSQLGGTYPLVLANEPVSTSDTIDSVNPSHESQIVGRCGRATPEHARRAIADAVAAFPAWRDTDPVRRAQYLLDVANAMRRRRYELAAWQVFECAKQWREA